MIHKLGTSAIIRHNAVGAGILTFRSLKLFCLYQRPQNCPFYNRLSLVSAPATIEPLSQVNNMSDEAYSSFLDNANQDTGTSKASTQSKSAATKAVNTEVPAVLKSVEQYYTSEADEPFEPVSLKWDGDNMPSESRFGRAILADLSGIRLLLLMVIFCR